MTASEVENLVRPTPSGVLGKYLRAEQLRAISDELHRLRSALTKIAEWQTHGPLDYRDADAMARLARAALDVSPEPPAAPVASDAIRAYDYDDEGLGGT